MDNHRATLKKHCFLWTLLIVVVLHFGSCAPRKCLHDMTYLDKHTNRRECCADICQYAQLTNSEDDCKSKCPKYNAPQAAPISKPEEEPKPKASSSQASSNDVIPVLVTIAVLAVCAMAIVALVALNRTRCARTRLPHDTNQRPRQADNNAIEIADRRGSGQQNQGNDNQDEASTALLTLGSSRDLSRPEPVEGDFQGRYFDQLENHGQPGNGFADNHLAANAVNNQRDAPVRRGVSVYAHLQQQANNVDAERNQAIGGPAREAQPLQRPIDETGDADGVISLQAVGN